MWGHEELSVALHGLFFLWKIMNVHLFKMNSELSALVNQVEANVLTVVENESSRNS